MWSAWAQGVPMPVPVPQTWIPSVPRGRRTPRKPPNKRKITKKAVEVPLLPTGDEETPARETPPGSAKGSRGDDDGK